MVATGKHGRGLFPGWFWVGVVILAGLFTLVLVLAATAGINKSKLADANKVIGSQELELQRLRRQNQVLGSQVRHLKETSTTLNQIREKVLQINQRRLSLVKWAALPDRGGNWISRIDNYLARTPLAGQGRTFYLAAVDAGIEPRLMPAIAMVESGGGRFNANTNNFFGRKAARGWAAWPTRETAIQNQGQYIRKMWGQATNPHSMRGYATSPVWGAKVSREMARI